MIIGGNEIADQHTIRVWQEHGVTPRCWPFCGPNIRRTPPEGDVQF
jgi:hypothetical protein